MQWFTAVLKKYATFSGRARRREYWFFTLFYILIYIALILVDMVTGSLSGGGIGLLSGLFALGMLIPSLAVTFRRLHDTNRSGWWILISLIPLIGGIVLLVFMVMDSQPGMNDYGDNPKEVAA